MKRPARQSQAVRLRLSAVAVLAAVLDRGQSLEPALAAGLEAVDERDRALLAEICNGVLRWHRLLETLLARTLRKPLRERERDLQRLLLVAAYQLCFMRVPDYAVVDGAVATARAGGWTWASGLVNAVLRNLARQHREWTGAIDDPAVRWALPDWIAARWRRDWPENFADLAEASAARPPMWLRVDRRRGSPAGYREELAAAGLTAESSAVGADALRLAEPVAVDRLPGFDQGRVSVQDLSAQLAAPLLAPQPGQRVLDACAAPGGKTLHLLEWQPELAELVALDSDELRLQRVRQNLDRCGCRASLVCADAGEVERWWDGRYFDRILLDAPCSGSGVIRRHPDIKHLRRAQDLDALVLTQSRLLDALWPLLAPGGILVYSTCSVFACENHEQLGAFLRRHPLALARTPELGTGRPSGPGWQILTGEGGGDGFFYGVVCRPPAPESGEN